MTLRRTREAMEYLMPQATTAQIGGAEIANQTEGRSGTNDEMIMTALRVLDFIRNGTGVSANTTRKGTVERATVNEGTELSDSTRYLTALVVKSILEHLNAQATTAKRGTVQQATNDELDAAINTTKYVTPALVKRSLQIYSMFIQEFCIMEVSLLRYM